MSVDINKEEKYMKKEISLVLRFYSFISVF